MGDRYVLGHGHMPVPVHPSASGPTGGPYQYAGYLLGFVYKEGSSTAAYTPHARTPPDGAIRTPGVGQVPSQLVGCRPITVSCSARNF